MGKTKKGVCVFNNKLQTTYPFIQTTTSESEVKCLKCHGRFSITSGGKNDITKHIKTSKHLSAVNAGKQFGHLKHLILS